MYSYNLQNPDRAIVKQDTVVFETQSHLQMGYHLDTHPHVTYWSYKNSGDVVGETIYESHDRTQTFVPDFIYLIESGREKTVEMVSFEDKEIIKGQPSTPEQEEQLLDFQERTKAAIQLCRTHGWFYRVLPLQ